MLAAQGASEDEMAEDRRKNNSAFLRVAQPRLNKVIEALETLAETAVPHR
jgi:hypothetical protein